MRGWVSAVRNYSEPVAIGTVMRSFTVGRVVESRHPGYRVGDHVTGLLGWQDYAVVDAAVVLRKIDATDLPVSTALGVLGINGATAHYGLLALGTPKAGETVVVSTAAGWASPAVRARQAFVGARSGLTQPSTTRPMVGSRRWRRPARRVWMSTSTTRPGRSAMP
jgi:NADPH-dependent curcumin reductase CurA